MTDDRHESTMLDAAIGLTALASWWLIRKASGLVVAAIVVIEVPVPWGELLAVVPIAAWIWWQWGRHWYSHRALRAAHGVEAADLIRTISRSWPTVARGCGLSMRPASHAPGVFGARVKTDISDEATWPIPKLLGLRPHSLGVAAELKPLLGQTVEQFDKAALALAHAVQVREVRVMPTHPHRPVELVFVLRSPLDESRDVAESPAPVADNPWDS